MRALSLRLLAAVSLGCAMLAQSPRYSTAKPEPAPVVPAGVDSPAQLAPYLILVPGEDGRELYVSAGGIGQVGGTLFVNLDVGPGHDKRSYTMVYSDTLQTYLATAVGFTPHESAYGTLRITTTLGLDSGPVDFDRAYVPAATVQRIISRDGNLVLAVVSTDTIPFDTYVAVVPGYAPPGPAPAGHRFVGSAYSVRAAGALLVTDKPMGLQLYYSEATLAGADPHTLALFAWDGFNRRWDNLGGRLFYDQKYLSVATSRFTTYALMATNTWRDEFDDFGGLDFPGGVSNVTLRVQGDKRELVLAGAALTGTAISKPITPTTAFAAWGNLTFTGAADPPTATLSVDILGLDGSVVMTDVAGGANLAGIDPAQHPALRLRVNLSSTVAGQTPSLDRWQVTWQVVEHKVYLPIVLAWRLERFAGKAERRE